ncbi:peroxidase-related enzyme [Arachidicoccus ginsenosidivorans]|uniref:Carboxymuconolactone decarboxylase family protein n=1 Tax=Arachidicoccus ginsenosidivorans TaxID=496057 RepID=A0A5B8VMY6_9BACT|nr:carboxymuconolactone decarboxylase family protein [Arachidicoccus ginsenosidivorans]QEC71588.1 carboxymuconolactone decarboxylase family protein [Arachidicoccus ginsenosidivorans]
MTTNFEIPKKESISVKNQKIFDKLAGALGSVPNLYAMLAYSDYALQTYINMENSGTSLTKRQVEVVNLAVSEVNGCLYCLSAHTAFSKLNGFSPSEIEELRQGKASFDPALDILAKLSKALTESRGHADPDLVSKFFAAGYTKENLMDVIVLIGDRTISNILHAVTKAPIDFPLAARLNG